MAKDKKQKAAVLTMAAFYTGGLGKILAGRIAKRYKDADELIIITPSELGECIYEALEILSTASAGLSIAIDRGADPDDAAQDQINLMFKQGYVNDDSFLQRIFSEEHQSAIHSSKDPFAKEIEKFKTQVMFTSKLSVVKSEPGGVEWMESKVKEILKNADESIDLSEHDCDNCDAADECPVKDDVLRIKAKQKRNIN